MSVACLICGHEANKSLQAHINKSHGMVKTEYEVLYPGAPILSEEFHAKISEKNRELVTRPGWSDKLSQGVKKLWQDPTYRKEHSEAVKKGQNTPEAKENHRKGFYKNWDNARFWETDLNRDLVSCIDKIKVTLSYIKLH